MQSFQISANSRELTGRKSIAVREAGLIPGVLYGNNVENRNLSVEYVPFEKLYSAAGESTLIDLSIDGGAPVKVLIQDIQRDAVKHRFVHVDFFQVNLKEKLHMNIPLKFVGEPMAVKTLGGILVESMDEIEVKCLPSALVHEIEVDVSHLAEFGSAVHVRDLKLPAGIEVLNDEDAVLAVINEPISEEELKALDEKPVEDVTAVEKVEKEKKEEEA